MISRIDILQIVCDDHAKSRIGGLKALVDKSSSNRLEMINSLVCDDKRVPFLNKVSANIGVQRRAQVFKSVFNLEVFNKRRLTTDE